MVADETRRSQRVTMLAALSFTGAAIALGLVISASVTLARGTPVPAPRGAGIGFLAFAVVRIALLVLAGLAYRARHRRARVLGLAWAALALIDTVIAVAFVGAPPLAAAAGALAPLVTIGVLVVKPPPELVLASVP